MLRCGRPTAGAFPTLKPHPLGRKVNRQSEMTRRRDNRSRPQVRLRVHVDGASKQTVALYGGGPNYPARENDQNSLPISRSIE
jgi:hypothetical protein